MPFLAGRRRTLFLALAARIVPETSRLDAGAQAQMLALVEEMIASRPAGMRRELALFFTLVRWAPALVFGRPLDRLSAVRQDRVLRWLQDAPSARLRGGCWGLKTLVFLGYYGRPEIGATIGYRPSRTGNALLHAR